MPTDPQSPEALLRAPNEIEAAAIVSALAEQGVEAFAVGAYTLGFVKFDSGINSVDVMVRHADIELAKQGLAKIKESQREIDWSQVDVGESDAPGPQTT
jgi:hypothetical protein